MHNNLLTGSSSDSVFFHRNFPIHFTVHSLTVHSLKPQWTMITSISSLQCAKSSWETGLLTVVWAKIKQNKKAKQEQIRADKKKKHFILETVYFTRRMEAEIGPLIPFWCELTFTAEKLWVSVVWTTTTKKSCFFYPPKTIKKQVGEKTQTREETFYPSVTTAGESAESFRIESI